MVPLMYCYLVRLLGIVPTISNPWKNSVSRHMDSRYLMGRVTSPKLSNFIVCSCKRIGNIYSIQIPRFISISSHISFTVHVFYITSERACGSCNVPMVYATTSKPQTKNYFMVYALSSENAQ
ncbi:hypothetical protein TNCT_573221 [Trichonephila clavata]|uniref:Uncharacterized protein n=1 Tax=Trichonephila clavata TaxID=2740835 RepID=A0A8X6LSY5_TRICU|nr:hypothetical protein TNCT_573221 [Trichonephila clavata]